MKTTIALSAAALLALSAPAFAGAHTQVNENAADAAANTGSVLGATVSSDPGSANVAGDLKSAGGWGNTGSALLSPLGQVSKGGPGGKSSDE